MEQLINDVSCVRTDKNSGLPAPSVDLDRKIVFMRLDSFSFREIAAALKLTKTAAIYRFSTNYSRSKSRCAMKVRRFPHTRMPCAMPKTPMARLICP